MQIAGSRPLWRRLARAGLPPAFDWLRCRHEQTPTSVRTKGSAGHRARHTRVVEELADGRALVRRAIPRQAGGKARLDTFSRSVALVDTLDGPIFKDHATRVKLYHLSMLANAIASNRSQPQ